jgi:uncharacterized membrane protein
MGAWFIVNGSSCVEECANKNINIYYISIGVFGISLVLFTIVFDCIDYCIRMHHRTSTVVVQEAQGQGPIIVQVQSA